EICSTTRNAMKRQSGSGNPERGRILRLPFHGEIWELHTSMYAKIPSGHSGHTKRLFRKTPQMPGCYTSSINCASVLEFPPISDLLSLSVTLIFFHSATT